MSSSNQLLQSGYSRVFIIENGASPTSPAQYEGLMRAAKATWDQGKVTTVFVPNASQYGRFDVAGKIAGEPGLPQIDIEALYTTDLSELLKLVAQECDHDLQLHFGVCRNPQDFNGGWDKIMVLEKARASNYSTTDLGAMQPSQAASVTETTKFEGQTLYEIKKLSFVERAQAQINDEVVAITFCDSPSCGSCGVPSDGCQAIFAVSKSSGASPGLLASVIFSVDGGKNWFNDPVDSLSAAQSPSDMICVGNNLIIVSSGAGAIEWADTSDVVAGVETWTQVTTGFVAAHGPACIFSLNEVNTIIGGLGGYIYQTVDPTSGATVVLDPGIATVENLNSISAADQDNVVIVGNNNAVVVTSDGGSVWTSITGPAVGVNLNSVWMQSLTEWWIGGADGNLYYTLNGGVTWARKIFPGSGSGSVTDIRFVTDSVGYLAHNTTTPKGRVLRTIDGGFSWYVLPDSAGSMPINRGFNALAVCADVNKVFAGGLANNNVDGIIVEGA